jgi:hypothetical protein
MVQEKQSALRSCAFKVINFVAYDFNIVNGAPKKLQKVNFNI